MHLLAVVLFLQVQADPFLERVEKGVTFPEKEIVDKVCAKSDWHKKVVKKLMDKEHWVAVLKAFEARTGISTGGLEIKVSFTAIDGAPARGCGTKGKGTIDCDVDKLAKNEKSIADFEKQKAAGATIVVPPARTDKVIPHELMHCYQGAPNQPDWVLEGMASWTGRDPNHICGYREAGQKTQNVDVEIPHDWVYTRGWAFFEWMETRHGAEKVKKFVALLIEGRKAEEAAAEVTGATWDDIKKTEKEWSITWIKKFKP